VPEGGAPSSQQGGEQGTSKGADGKGTLGRGSGRSATGGGGAEPGEPGGNPPRDDTKASPRVDTPPLNSEESVAPQNVPPSDLTLRKVQELLRDPDAARKLEQESGYTREQMEQFVQKFQKEKAPRAAARPGEEIQVKPGESRPAGPAPNLPGINPQTRFSTQSLRDRGAVATDQVRDNLESTRLLAPAEFRERVEAYKSTLSRSRVLNPTTSPPGGGTGPGNR
jgi:hypothetical protein